jgi:hypothetical protein
MIRHFTFDSSKGDAVICIRVALAPETSSFHIDNVHLNHVMYECLCTLLPLGSEIKELSHRHIPDRLEQDCTLRDSVWNSLGLTALLLEMSQSTTILRICLLLLASLACVLAQQDYYKTLGGELLNQGVLACHRVC